MTYVEGFVAAVPTASREAYTQMARDGAAFFKGLGATRVVECWGDDVPRGEVTDFYRATRAADDETIIFSWVEFPDKETRDAAHQKMTENPPDMSNLPFDGKRMFFGGFELLLDE